MISFDFNYIALFTSLNFLQRHTAKHMRAFFCFPLAVGLVLCFLNISLTLIMLSKSIAIITEKILTFQAKFQE